jgi:hypothetical protein
MLRLEIVNYANTTRLGSVLQPFDVRVRTVLGAEETLSFSLAMDEKVRPQIGQSAVVRLVETGYGVRAAFRVTHRRFVTREDGARLMQVTAAALWTDLARHKLRQRFPSGRVSYEVAAASQPPEVWLSDFIVPAAAPGAVSFTVGLVKPTTPLSLSFSRANALVALRNVVDALQQAGAGGELRFTISANGLAYTVDLLTRIGTNRGAYITGGHNLRAVEMATDETTLATRVTASGAGLLTLADARWRIATIDGSVGARGLTFDVDPVFEDDAHAGLWFFVPGKGAYPITVSEVGFPGIVSVDDTALPALAIGDVGFLASDDDGTPLDYLESPVGVGASGIIEGHLDAADIPDANNLIPNPDGSQVSGGLPAFWTLVGGATAVETTSTQFALRGGRAWIITCPADGAGIKSAPFTIAADEVRPFFSTLAELTPQLGLVRSELLHSNGKRYPEDERRVSQGIGTYMSLGGVVSEQPLPPGTGWLQLSAHNGPATFVWDGAVASAVVSGSSEISFVAGAGAHVLYARAVRELADRTKPRLEVRVTVANLYEVDRALYSFARLEQGDDVLLRNADTGGQQLLRVMEITEDPWDAAVIEVVLAVGPARRLPDPRRPPAGGEALPASAPDGGGPVDEDALPSLSGFTLWEDPAGTLRGSVIADDDVSDVEFFASLGGWPTEDGLPEGPVLERFRKATRPRASARFSTPAADGTWYAIAVGYNAARNSSVRATGTQAVGGGGAGGFPALNEMSVSLAHVGATWHHVLAWKHTQAAADVGCIVEIVEDDAVVVAVAAARLVATDADGTTPGVGQAGGWMSAAVVPADASTPGAVSQRHAYRVRLLTSAGDPLATFAAERTYYYLPAAGGGEGGGGGDLQPPGEVPSVPVVTNRGNPASGSTVMRAEWTLATQQWPVDIEWFEDGISLGVTHLATAATFHERTFVVHTPTRFAAGRVRLVNDAGDGVWTDLTIFPDPITDEV